MVLQIFLRHTNSIKLSDKIGTFIYRLTHLEEWLGQDLEDSQRGIGISAGFIDERILSKYYIAINDKNGMKIAEEFEGKTLEFLKKYAELYKKGNFDIDEYKNRDELINDYDDVLHSTLILTAYMKGDMSYILPKKYFENEEKPYVAANLEQFRQYFVKIINEFQKENDGYEHIISFIRDNENDNSFKYFVDYQRGK